MKFENIEQRNAYFDLIIDTYKSNDFELCENLIIQLSIKEARELVYFLHTHKESLSPGLFSFVLDFIF